MIRTEEALDALAAALDAVSSLPDVLRDAQLPTHFKADGSGAGRFLNLRKGDSDRVQLLGMGAGPGERVYEIDHFGEIEWLVEHRTRAVRNAAFQAGLAAMDDAIAADVTLGGVVSNAQIERVEFGGLVTEGIPEIEAAIVTVRLTFTSDRPF